MHHVGETVVLFVPYGGPAGGACSGTKNSPVLVKLKKSISFEEVFCSEGVSCELRVNYGVVSFFYHTDEK